MTRLVDHINAIASQLPTGFGDDSHKARYLRRAVIRFDWAQNSIAQVATSKYTFTQFITPLQESMQITEEINRARALGTNYIHYLNNRKSARHANNPAMNRDKRWSLERSLSPHPCYRYSRSPSDHRNRKSAQHRFSIDYGRRNPALRKQRFCYG